MNLAFHFEIKDMFEEAWVMLKDKIEVGDCGEVYLPDEIIEKLANHHGHCETLRFSFNLKNKSIPDEVLGMWTLLHGRCPADIWTSFI